jgi:hypothetical protein
VRPLSCPGSSAIKFLSASTPGKAVPEGSFIRTVGGAYDKIASWHFAVSVALKSFSVARQE